MRQQDTLHIKLVNRYLSFFSTNLNYRTNLTNNIRTKGASRVSAHSIHSIILTPCYAPRCSYGYGSVRHYRARFYPVGASCPLALCATSAPGKRGVDVFLGRTNVSYRRIGFGLSRKHRRSPRCLRVGPGNGVPTVISRRTKISIFRSTTVLNCLSRGFSYLRPGSTTRRLIIRR